MRLDQIHGKININQMTVNKKPFLSPDGEIKRDLQIPHKDVYLKSVSFAGANHPPVKLIKNIILDLKGENKNAFSPDYICSEAKELMSKFFGEKVQKDSGVYEQLFKLLQEKKTVAENFKSMMIGDEFHPKAFFAGSVKTFLEEMSEQLKSISDMASKVGLKENEINYLRKIITDSAPTLFLMGHSDAIGHASQVCRKCMVDTKRQKADNLSILQSGIVGWLHDPKFSSGYSRENLATHPIIAGALLNEFVSSSQQNLYKILKDYDMKKSFDLVIKEMQEALYTNNDSSYIVNNVLLARMPYFSEKEELMQIVNKRLTASSKGNDAPIIPEKILAQLRQTQFETGIKKIDNERLNQAISNLFPSKEHDSLKPDFLKLVLEGEYEPKSKAKDFIVELKKIGAISDTKISSNYLFIHQQELESARFLGENLVNADLLMLSPQKILKEGFEPTLFGRIQSFCNSFDDNIKNISLEHQQSAQQLQKKVFISMLNAMDKLKNLPEKDYSQTDVMTLREIIRNPKTWGEYGEMIIGDKSSKNSVEVFIKKIEGEYKASVDNNQQIMKV